MNSRNWIASIAMSLLFTVFATPSRVQARTWNLNDVSILYPLSDQMLSPAELLPRDVYDKHPVADGESDKNYVYQHLRVVGVRIDPKARQIRMTWQPIAYDTTARRWVSEDRAAHTFYLLSTVQLKLFLDEWSQLGGETGRRALGVHPGFTGSNASQFTQRLNQLLSKYCNRRALIQYTSMLLKPDLDWWFFGGLEFKLSEKTHKKEWQVIDIPFIKNDDEELFSFTKRHDEIKGQLHAGYDNNKLSLERFMIGYDYTPYSKDLYQKALVSAVQFQNPGLFTAAVVTQAEKDRGSKLIQLDCVSCHIAHPVQHYISLVASDLKPNQADAFQNPNPAQYDLTNKTIGGQSTRVIRAFGYFESEPAINQRVINESALSADYMNAVGAGK